MKNNYVTKVSLLIFIFFCSVLSWGQISESFESGLPTAYSATTTYTLGSGSWTGQANGVIRSTTGVQTGAYSCQLRSQTGAQITTPNITSTVGSVTFYGSSSTTSGSIQVNYSTDGGLTWTPATGSPFTLTTGAGVLKTAVINSASPNILVQFYRTAATVYIDDININTYSSNTITTNTSIVGSPFCVTSSTGAAVSVPFTSVGTFTTNTYTAQLSNAAGSFAAPTNIGTLVSDSNIGTITATIPANTTAGTGYRIRVVSNNPVVTGSNNGTNLTVNLAGVSVLPTTTQNIGVAVNGTLLTATENAGVVSRQWYYSTVSGGPYTTPIAGATTTTYTPNFALPNTYYVVCISTYACGTVTTAQVQINVSLIPDILLSSANPAFPAGNITEGSLNNVVYAFNTAVTTTNATLNSVTFTTTGTYAAANITNIKLWYSTDAVFNSVSDTNIKTITTGLGTGAHTFSALTQAIANGATGYFFITVDLPCPSTALNTFGINAITTANLNFASGNKSGTAFANGTQTIQDDIPTNVTGAVTSNCLSNASTIGWSLPTNCYDNILIFATNGSFTSTLPTGTGSTYTANTVFTSGTAFDGGFCVYKGTGSTVTVTGLTNAVNYTYKIFTRTGTSWSSGVEVSCIPVGSLYCPSSGNTSFATSLTNVTLNTINNTSAKPSGYSDYTGISTNLQQGATYALSAKINTDGNFTVLGFAWIDFNQDGDFADVGEAIDLGAATNVTNGLTSSSPFAITVPINAVLGVTRMRVVATYNGDSSPCLTGFDGEVEDYAINITAACVPTHSVASFAPTSGPTGTDVTINGSGFTAGTTVTFNGIAATVVFVNATQIIATVPAGSTTGTIKVNEAGCNLYVTPVFTQTKQSGVCSSGNNLNDLIISEVYDSVTNNSWYMELYNPTGTAINLDAAGADYKLVRYGDIGTTTGLRSVDISGIIPPGGVYLADIGSDSSCGALAFEYTNKGNGINENDEIRLTKNDVTVDIVNCPNEKGYTIRRNALATGPAATYNAADWTLLLNETCADLDIVPFSGTSSLPSISANPIDVSACTTLASFVVNATASGAGVLTYQWYYNDNVAAGWSVVNAGSFAGVTITGNTSATLSLNGAIDAINGYQFYCAVLQNGTCTLLSDAAQLKTQSTTWNGSAWSNGVPSLTKAAVIDGTYVTATNGNFSCCSLTVNATKSLTVSGGGYVEVQNNITNNGTFEVLSNGSLVQISDSGVNTGSIRYNRTANIRRQDYVYWSSPVGNFASNAVSPGTSLGYQYKWLPTTGGTNNFGNWTYANETMVLGKGYCLRGPDSFSLSALSNYTATFVGVPNNGVVTIPISRGNWNGGTYSTGVSSTLGTNEDDNWNLVGNPYPSAIHAVNFLTLNTNLAGFVNIWTHGTLPSSAIADPFYNNYAYNYTPGDYITYNAAGASSGPGVFNGRIAGGQGFFVSMLHTSAGTTENLTFNNSLRNITFDSSQFYRSSTVTSNSDDLEKHRIWFDLVTPTGTSIRSLLGYVENATNGNDRLFDAFSNEKLSFNVFSLVGDEKMLIQGRNLPFDNNDKVNIGVTLPQDGLFKIALGAVDGLFSNPNQNIYLEDKLLNVIYDLRVAPYSFMGTKGTTKDRFVIRYNTNEVLANDTFDATTDVILVSNQELSVSSTKEKITNILVFDVLGRKLFEGKNINSNNFTLPVNKRNAPLLMEITLENGVKVNKKSVF